MLVDKIILARPFSSRESFVWRRGVVLGILSAYAAVMLLINHTYMSCWSDLRLLWLSSVSREKYNPMSYWFLATTELARGNPAAAYEIGEFFEGQKDLPDLPPITRWSHYLSARYIKGTALAKLGRHQEALWQFEDIGRHGDVSEKSFSNRVFFIDMQSTMGECYLATNRPKLAAEKFKLISETLDPSSYKALFYMGISHYLHGELNEAERDFRQCLEIWPEDEKSRYNLERIAVIRAGTNRQ